MVAYDHELIYAIGSMLGVGSVPKMLGLFDEMDSQGLDAMSGGVSLAWATEAFQRGLVSTKETDGLTLGFGDAETYIQATRRIVAQPTDFYRALARGAARAASIYGGADFALTFGGNEMPGYHTGPAGHLGYLTGARHSHLDAAGYSIDQAAAKKGQTLTPEGVVSALVTEERWRQVLGSLVVCFFARGLYTEDTVLKALAVAGFNWSADDLKRLGQETLAGKNDFKVRQGFDLPNIPIPHRIYETLSPMGMIDEGFMRQALQKFADEVKG
jgi:aldehyde:ferredoxin oxidoreductase